MDLFTLYHEGNFSKSILVVFTYNFYYPIPKRDFYI